MKIGWWQNSGEEVSKVAVAAEAAAVEAALKEAQEIAMVTDAITTEVTKTSWSSLSVLLVACVAHWLSTTGFLIIAMYERKQQRRLEKREDGLGVTPMVIYPQTAMYPKSLS